MGGFIMMHRIYIVHQTYLGLWDYKYNAIVICSLKINWNKKKVIVLWCIKRIVYNIKKQQ